MQDNWVAATYTNSYTTLLSSWKKIKQESEKTETPEIFALAQILKISAWHKTLESFGPIPYTHAGEPALVIPFDSEQVAFNAMFTDLTAAIDILTVRAEQGATIVADYDAVYAGDTRKWVKYANSLMLCGRNDCTEICPSGFESYIWSDDFEIRRSPDEYRSRNGLS